jgi:hypothetical protein
VSWSRGTKSWARAPWVVVVSRIARSASVPAAHSATFAESSSKNMLSTSTVSLRVQVSLSSRSPVVPPGVVQNVVSKPVTLRAVHVVVRASNDSATSYMSNAIVVSRRGVTVSSCSATVSTRTRIRPEVKWSTVSVTRPVLSTNVTVSGKSPNCTSAWASIVSRQFSATSRIGDMAPVPKPRTTESAVRKTASSRMISYVRRPDSGTCSDPTSVGSSRSHAVPPESASRSSAPVVNRREDSCK